LVTERGMTLADVDKVKSQSGQWFRKDNRLMAQSEPDIAVVGLNVGGGQARLMAAGHCA
jgi:hypothetical protein